MRRTLSLLLALVGAPSVEAEVSQSGAWQIDIAVSNLNTLHTNVHATTPSAEMLLASGGMEEPAELWIRCTEEQVSIDLSFGQTLVHGREGRIEASLRADGGPPVAALAITDSPWTYVSFHDPVALLDLLEPASTLTIVLPAALDNPVTLTFDVTGTGGVLDALADHCVWRVQED